MPKYKPSIFLVLYGSAKGKRHIIGWVIGLALVLLAVTGGWWLKQYLSAGLQPQSLTACYVHGEHVRLYFQDFSPQNVDLQAADGTVYRFSMDSDALNHGMTWIYLPDGTYRLFGDSVALRAAPGYEQEGYSLTRQGCNRYWRLYGSRGYLFLSLSTVDQLPEDVYDIIIDAGIATTERDVAAIKSAATVIWNGTVGMAEWQPTWSYGSFAIANAIAEQTRAGKLESIVGGGDTVAALTACGVKDDITYVSTGGGAFLEFIEGRTLPGIAILESK